MKYYDPLRRSSKSEELQDTLNINKTVKNNRIDSCSFNVTLSVEGKSKTSVLPLYIVFVIDATTSMGTIDINNNTTSRYTVLEEAILSYLNRIFSDKYESIVKHIAIVSFGNGARVHVTSEDATGKFSSLVNPNPSTTSPTGKVVTDYYIGANSWDPDQATTALNNYNNITDKKDLFYDSENEVFEMIDNISRYSNTNCQSGILLAHDMLKSITEEANKVIVFVTDGESAASSNFYTYYREANIPEKIKSSSLVKEGEILFVVYNDIRVQVTNNQLSLEGINPNNYDIEKFTPLQIVNLKTRALATSLDFFNETAGNLSINPFAGEWHNFDLINSNSGPNKMRVSATPSLLNNVILNGYYWSNGLISNSANYFYYSQRPSFVKSNGIWKYSLNDSGVPLIPVYTDSFWAQSIIGQDLNTVTFDNSKTECMIFATDQKIPQTRMIDYYENINKNTHASNEAKKFMIQAAQDARFDGIIIKAVGIGETVLLPEYLNEVDSTGIAYIVPYDIDDAQSSLSEQMVNFIEKVINATNNIIITETIPRRNSNIECINDNTFTVDLKSIKIAYLHDEEGTPNFQPIDLDTSGIVDLTLDNNRYILTFLVGTLWAKEDSSKSDDRYFKALIEFIIKANKGVKSGNTDGIEDIPTNGSSIVQWTEVGKDVYQELNIPKVYLDESCTICPRVTRYRAIIDIVEAVALEQKALSNILKAEGEKLQAVISKGNITNEQLMKINKSATSLINAVTRLDMILQNRLNKISWKIEECK